MRAGSGDTMLDSDGWLWVLEGDVWVGPFDGAGDYVSWSRSVRRKVTSGLRGVAVCRRATEPEAA